MLSHLARQFLGASIGLSTGAFLIHKTAASSTLSLPRYFSSIMAQSNIYDFTATDIDGNSVKLGDKYADHVCIIVNVASKWGKTAVNYKQLVELFNKYSETEGLRILAFPCNQFGGQEPGTNEEIKAFAEGYGVKFDMYSKIDVNGSNAHPLFDYLKSKQGGTLGNFIKWNFTKFVVDKNGIPVARFGPTDDPIPKVEECIKKYF